MIQLFPPFSEEEGVGEGHPGCYEYLVRSIEMDLSLLVPVVQLRVHLTMVLSMTREHHPYRLLRSPSSPSSSCPPVSFGK